PPRASADDRRAGDETPRTKVPPGGFSAQGSPRATTIVRRSRNSRHVVRDQWLTREATIRRRASLRGVRRPEDRPRRDGLRSSRRTAGQGEGDWRGPWTRPEHAG